LKKHPAEILVRIYAHQDLRSWCSFAPNPPILARPDRRGFRWKPRRAVAGGRKPVGKGPATVPTFVNPAAPAWAGAATRLPGAGRRGRI